MHSVREKGGEFWDEERLRVNLIETNDETKEDIDRFVDGAINGFNINNTKFTSTYHLYDVYINWCRDTDTHNKLGFLMFCRRFKTGVEKLLLKKINDKKLRSKLKSRIHHRAGGCRGYRHIHFVWDSPDIKLVKDNTKEEPTYPKTPYRDD